MKKSLINFKNSLSTKLSLLLVFFTTVILVTALVYLFTVSHNAIRQEAINHATEILENTTLRVNSILNSVELAARNSEWLILRHLDNPDSMFVYSRHIINNNPDLNGCSIAFEPDFFNQRGHYFSAFSYNDHGTILTTQEGNEHYEYFYMDWYQLCKLLDRPVWTEPFFDYNPVEIYPHEAVASYCVPIKDPDGKYVGTMSLDVSLEWLSNTISAVKPYPNSYNIMIGQGGTFFVHPDSTKLFYQTIFTETLEHEDTALAALGHAMLRGEKGMRQLVFDGQESYVFYKPIENTGWSVAIVCPESDIFGAFNRLQRAVAIAVIGGLLLLLIVCLRIISHELKPLRLLAEQAGTIAKGNFDETLPDSKRTDEIGQLSHSFSNMQQSLAGYIEELKLT
ncbi:MAG: HAMP domain-containing protein, partial [Bacteroidales bacterium]|nr:HAMP domain-containing protein [Bacteroidales bacterium]